MRLGQFRIEERVGRGGMGVVYRAVWEGAETTVPVAVKFVTRGVSTGLAERNFLHEARMAARLSHPNVVTLLDAGRLQGEVTFDDRVFDRQTPYLVMEWVDGPTIDKRPPAEWRELRTVIENLLGALAHAHAWNVLHRDIKPGNVLTSDEPFEVKLTDFGIGRGLESDQSPSAESEGRVVGTPHYMAPEQILGSWRDEGPWTDLYGVGILAWRLATGEVPFRGKPQEILTGHVREELPRFEPLFDVPIGFTSWLQRMLDKSSRKRFDTAADARRSLLALEGRPGGPWIVPETWQNDDRPIARRLRAAGLGLYGMRRPPLAGRESEKKILWTALRQTASELKPRGIVIRGGPGSGKTSLAEWLARRAAEGGHAINLRAFHEPHPVPGEGLEGMLARQLRIDGLDREAASERLTDVLTHFGFGSRAAPLAVEVAERTVATERTRRGLASRDEWFGVLSKILTILAGERLLYVTIDDAQWGEASVDFARRLLDSSLPVLVVLTLRDRVEPRGSVDRFLEGFIEHPATSAVELPNLPEEHQRKLVGDLLNLDPGLTDEVVDRTGGSPLFAVQLVGDWVMRDLLEPGADGYVARDEISELPDDIHTIWQERVRSALARTSSSGDLRALQLAAVLGSDVDRGEWEGAAKRSGCVPSPDLLDLLVVSGLVAWRFGGFSFVHRMLRESILQDADELRLLHRSVADTLIAAQRHDGRTAERIAWHLRCAEDFAGAFVWLCDTIERYYQEENIDAIVTLGGELSQWSTDADGGDALAHAEALVRYGTVLRFRVQMDDAVEALSVADRLARGDRAEEDFIRAPDRRRNRILSRVHGEYAIVCDETRLNPDDSLRHARAGQALAAAAGLPLEEAWSASLAASTLGETGHPTEALEVAKRALATLQSAGLEHTKHGMNAHFTLSEVAKANGDREALREHLQAGLEIAEQIGQRVGVAYGLGRVADEAYFDGRLKDAREASQLAMELYRETGSPTAEYMEANLVLYELEQGLPEGCRERVERVLARWEDYGIERLAPVLRMALAVCHAAEGDDEAAREQFERAMNHSEESGRVVDDVVVHAVLLTRYTDDEALSNAAVQFVSRYRELLPTRYSDVLDTLDDT